MFDQGSVGVSGRVTLAEVAGSQPSHCCQCHPATDPRLTDWTADTDTDR